MERIRFDQKGYRQFFDTCFKTIYQPNHDSRYLVDAVEKMLPIIMENVKPDVCLEIGCGSGFVINSIAKHFGSKISKYYATDINSVAIETTLASGRANGVTIVNVIKTDLVNDLKMTLQHQVDLLVTNPPFEPSSLQDIGKPGSICAWSAGHNGRAVIDRILVELPELMTDRGLVLMCCIEENDINDIREQMRMQNFYSNIVIERDGTTSSNYNRNYHQYVLAFSKNNYWTINNQ